MKMGGENDRADGGGIMDEEDVCGVGEMCSVHYKKYHPMDFLRYWFPSHFGVDIVVEILIIKSSS